MAATIDETLARLTDEIDRYWHEAAAKSETILKAHGATDAELDDERARALAVYATWLPVTVEQLRQVLQRLAAPPTSA